MDLRIARLFAILLLCVLLGGLSALPQRGQAAPLSDPVNPGTTNLVACWSLNETSGTRYDSYGDNDLSDNNTVGYDAGKVGNSAKFVAANNEYLSIADNADISLSGNFTMAAWFNFASKPGSYADLIVKWGNPDNEYALLYISDQFRFYISSNGSDTLSVSATNYGAITTGTWAYVVMWYDGSALRISVNDGTANTTTHSSGINNATSLLGLGLRGTGTAYYDGRIDEMVIYKRALTADERTWLYNSGSGRSCADLNPPTPTPTYTPTNTPAATNTPTYTPTNTYTPTITDTPTLTYTPTNTFTPTNTLTATYTHTNTPTKTLTPTQTDTPTETMTPTQTNTPGGPTDTPGPMPTAFFGGEITYGDTALLVALGSLLIVVVLFGLYDLVKSQIQKRKD